MSNQFPKLFTPIKLGPVTVKNRIVITAHHIFMADKEGTPLPEAAAYYEERAKGGVGMIITGPHDVHESMSQPGSSILWDKKSMPGYKRIADAIHKHNCVAVGQMWHGGRQSYGKGGKGEPWAPSAIPLPIGGGRGIGNKPHEVA